jgi:tetratricopeptide (TPR) repeat protein
LAPLPILRDTSLLYGAAALALLAGLLFLTWPRRWGRIAFGLIWFLAFLLPGLVFSEPSQFIGVALYEHRLYLPLIGLLIVFLETGLFRDLDGKNRLGLTVVLAVLAVFSVKTFTYSEIYRDRISFWESAARSSPHHAMARRNLGAIYWLDGKPDKAELEYRQALALNPNEPMVHNNLALIYMEKGRLREAKRELLHELRLNPNYDRALLNLGLLYAQQGRIKEAVALWQKTLEINPANGAAREYLRRLNAR